MVKDFCSEMKKNIAMMFSPLFPIVFSFTVSGIFLIVLSLCLCRYTESGTTRYDILIALSTGVIASWLVSTILELSKNYAANRKSLIYLIDYYSAISVLIHEQSSFKSVYIDKDQNESRLVLILWSFQKAVTELNNLSDVEMSFLDENEIVAVKRLLQNDFSKQLLSIFSGEGGDVFTPEFDPEVYSEFLELIKTLEKELRKKPYYGYLAEHLDDITA